MNPIRVLAGLLLFVGSAVAAPQSQDFILTESSFDVGGAPVASPTFQVTLSSAGQGAPAGGVSNPAFSMSIGLVAVLRPAGEVKNLRFTNRMTLVWNPEGSTGNYQLYRGTITRPFDTGYGSCASSGLAGETAVDASAPSAGQSFFYLATARNGLGEEGTKGSNSAGTERANSAPCP